MSVYEGIMKGLNEALEHAEGKRELRTNTLFIEPVREYRAEEIKKIRNDLRMRLFQRHFTGRAHFLYMTQIMERTFAKRL